MEILITEILVIVSNPRPSSLQYMLSIQPALFTYKNRFAVLKRESILDCYQHKSTYTDVSRLRNSLF